MLVKFCELISQAVFCRRHSLSDARAGFRRVHIKHASAHISTSAHTEASGG